MIKIVKHTFKFDDETQTVSYIIQDVDSRSEGHEVKEHIECPKEYEEAKYQKI
jgi:hypothetical protein